MKGRANAKNRSTLKSIKAVRQHQKQMVKSHRLFAVKHPQQRNCENMTTAEHHSFSGNHKGLSVLFIFLVLTGSLIQQAKAATAKANLPKLRYNNAAIADELNQLYSRTTPCSNNQPAYHCSGIIIHGQLVPDTENPLPSWRLPGYRNIGSFSYLRSDITAHIGEPVWINTGFILTPLEEVAKRKQYPYKVYCEFPGDGGTVGDADNSCHFNSDSEYSPVCTGNYNSIAEFLKKYPPDQYGSPWSPEYSRCAFLPDKNSFDFVMKLHKFFFRENVDKTRCKETPYCRVHNEMVIGTWNTKEVPDINVPIQAFYAIMNDTFNPMFKGTGRTSTSEAELNQLFKDADEYSKATNNKRQIPVVTLDMGKLRNGDNDIFALAVRPKI